MSENNDESKEPHGVILGYWDKENTPKLIKDLEYCVKIVEKKCKKLLQQLLFYKKFSEEFHQSELQTSLYNSKSDQKRNYENSQLSSGSVPDITFRKNQINFEDITDVFQENFQEKLRDIHKDLISATDKIGLKDTIFLFPTEKYVKSLNEKAEDGLKTCFVKVKDEFMKLNSSKAVTKSVCTMIEPRDVGGLGFAKITKNELELYQNLSKLSLEKGKKSGRKQKAKVIISSADGRRGLKVRKINTKKKAFGCFRYTNMEEGIKKSKVSTTRQRNKGKQSVWNKSSPRKDTKFKKKKDKATSCNSSKSVIYNNNKSQSWVSCDKKSSNEIKEKVENLKKVDKNTSEVDKMCHSLIETINKTNLLKDVPEKIENKSSLRSIIKNSIPFTTCTSTNKSFNVGMNIQQFLSLTKYAKKSGNNATGTPPGNSDKKNTQPEHKVQAVAKSESKFHMSSQNMTNSNYIVTTYPWSPREGTVSQDFAISGDVGFNSQDINQIERKDVWISKHCTSNMRKVRSKYTGSSPESYMEYHKSTTRQYTNGQKSVIKSESKTTYAVGAKIMVSDCQRTDFFEIEKHSCFQNASGDGSCNKCCTKLKNEWVKGYSTFLDLYRKYAALKVQIANDEELPPETDLKALESEIDLAIEKYKEFLKYYSKFLHLNHRLKSLKILCKNTGLGPVTSFSASCVKEINSVMPTSGGTERKKALRQMQILQEKIKQLD